MKRGVLEPEPGVAIRILEFPSTVFGAYRILPNSTRFDLQVRGTILLNSTFLCEQAMRPARGLHTSRRPPQSTICTSKDS